MGNSRMNKPAKAQEPSMDEILASIRRIIADDDAGKAQTGHVPPELQQSAPTEPSPGGRMPGITTGLRQPFSARSPAAGAALAQQESASRHTDYSVSTDSRFEIGAARDFATRPSVDPSPTPADLDAPPSIAANTSLPPPPNYAPLGNQPVAMNYQPASPNHPAASEPAASQQAAPPPVFRDSGGPMETAVLRTHEEPRRHAAQNAVELALLSTTTSAAVDSAFGMLAQKAAGQHSSVPAPRSIEDVVQDMLRPMLKNWLDDNLPSLVERLVRAEIERVSRGR
jgi:cell pole-organizing protein PopZ